MSQPLPPDFNPFQEDEMPEAPAPVRRVKPGARTFLITLGVLFALAFVLYAGVFRVRRVAVVGNEHVSWDEVVEAAGLKNGVSYFAIDPEKIAAGIQQNRYLICEKVEASFPNAIAIYLRERKGCANVRVMGVTYLMDEEGMVLERDENGSLFDGIPVVTGLQAREVRVGRIVSCSNASQKSVYTDLMRELALQGFSGEVSELNLSNPDSLYLITRNGYTVHLGNAEDLRAKIGTVRGVIAKLQEMGKSGGVLEASVPEVVTYMDSDM